MRSLITTLRERHKALWALSCLFMACVTAFTFTSCGDDEVENGAPSFLIGEWSGSISGVRMTYTFRSDNSGNVDISGGNNMDFTYTYTETSSDGGALNMAYDDGTSVYAVVVKLSDTKINLVVDGDIITLTKGGSGNNEDNGGNGDNGGSNNDSQANYTRDILGTWQKSGSSDQITFYSDGTCHQYSSASDKWYDTRWHFMPDYANDENYIIALVIGYSVYGIESLTSSKMVLTYNNKEYVYYKR